MLATPASYSLLSLMIRHFRPPHVEMLKSRHLRADEMRVGRKRSDISDISDMNPKTNIAKHPEGSDKSDKSDISGTMEGLTTGRASNISLEGPAMFPEMSNL